METVVLAARVLLAAVFVVAAVGKLLDLPGSRASLLGFGVPQRAANLFGTALPVAELAVAIALVPTGSARWGAVGALVLLGAFVAGIANSLRKGEAPPCNCFGAIHSAPASRWTLARNVALAAVAAVAVGWGPGPGLGAWVEARSAAELAAVGLGVLALALALVAAPMWLENRRLREDLDDATARLARTPPGPRIGALAPEFELPDGEGGTYTLSSLLARRRPVVLVFTIAGCGPCEPMLPELRRLREIAADRITVALVGLHTIEHYDRLRDRHPGDLRLVEAIAQEPSLGEELDALTEIAHRYDVHDSPGALLVTPAGTIGSPVVAGRLAIEALIRRTLADAPAPVSGAAA